VLPANAAADATVSLGAYSSRTLEDAMKPLAAAFALLLFAAAAEARPMQVLQTTPAPNATIESLNMQFAIRFDGIVDHRASRLYVTQGDKLIEELHPLLTSAPEVLYASSPRLPEGSYELHWDGRSTPDGDFTSGMLPFTVKP
jgi:methionine-rich copper-binding protein CopC